MGNDNSVKIRPSINDEHVFVAPSSGYIDVNLTESVIGSNEIVKHCEENKSSFHCQQIRNIMFLMCNRKYYGNNNFTLNKQMDWRYRSNGLRGDLAYHVSSISSNDENYIGNNVKQIDKVLEHVEKLINMSLLDLSKIDGINVPKAMIDVKEKSIGNNYHVRFQHK